MRAAVKSSRSMLGRIATSATWSGPFSSAIRRRASSSTWRVKRADPPARPPGVASSSVRPSASSACDDPVDQLAGRDPLQGGVRRPAGQPGAAARASRRTGPPSRRRAAPAPPGRRRPAPRRAARGTRPAPAPLSRTGLVGGLVARLPPGALADQPREVEVEERVEGRPLALPLDQRRGVRRRWTVPRSPHGSDAERGDRVEVLGQRHRQAGPAQRLEEGDVRARPGRCSCPSYLRSRSSRIARSWSEACLRTTPSVSSTALSSRSRISSAIRVRAQSTDSAIDGGFFSSRSRSRADGRDQLAGDPLLEVGHLARARSRARAPRRGSRGAGRGSAA